MKKLLLAVFVSMILIGCNDEATPIATWTKDTNGTHFIAKNVSYYNDHTITTTYRFDVDTWFQFSESNGSTLIKSQLIDASTGKIHELQRMIEYYADITMPDGNIVKLNPTSYLIGSPLETRDTDDVNEIIEALIIGNNLNIKIVAVHPGYTETWDSVILSSDFSTVYNQ